MSSYITLSDLIQFMTLICSVIALVLSIRGNIKK